MKHNFLLPLTTGLLLAGFAGQALAQAPAKEPKIVNRDELRVCMNSESALSTNRQALEARKVTNRTEVTAIREEAAKMAEDSKAIDPADDRKSRAFKRVVDAHNARVKAANAASEAFNTDLEGLNKMTIAHNEKCAGISFKSEDKEAILKERATK